MRIFYDPKTDYLEVLNKSCPNYGNQIREGIFEFRGEYDNKIIGYGVVDASEAIESLDFFEPTTKFSIMVKMLRMKKGLTQARAAEMIGIALLPYQRIESGKNNPTLKTILKIKKIFPELKLDKVA